MLFRFLSPAVVQQLSFLITACLKVKLAKFSKLVMEDCNVHTILRLPRGTFSPYSQGVKANVVFFQKGFPTENLWIFDARSNVPGITKKERPLYRHILLNLKNATATIRTAAANERTLVSKAAFVNFISAKLRTRLQTRHHLAERRITRRC